jgi:hypothetical protein
MDKNFIENKKNKALIDKINILCDISDKISNSPYIDEIEFKLIMEYINKKIDNKYNPYITKEDICCEIIHIKIRRNKEIMYDKINELTESLPIDNINDTLTDFNQYLDSSPVHFHGDIIITDPCYVIKDDDWDDFLKNSHLHSWDNDGIYNKIDSKYIKGMMFRDTLYGYWSCTTYDTNTKKEIGNFCADAGLVSVMDLAIALKYNPDFNYHISKNWTTTLIKDFDGDVYFKIKHSTYQYEGVLQDDYEVRIVGHGVNIKTNEPIDFETSQTGL